MKITFKRSSKTFVTRTYHRKRLLTAENTFYPTRLHKNI